MASGTVTSPAIDVTQLGSGNEAQSIMLCDAFGRVTWTHDPLGVLSYTGYDSLTGAVSAEWKRCKQHAFFNGKHKSASVNFA